MSEPSERLGNGRLRLELDGRGVLTLSLARVEKRNALDFESLEALDRALDRAGEPDVRLVVLRGEGPGFSSGVDVGALAGAVAGRRHADFRRLVSRLQAVPDRMVELEKPVVAVLHGFALGLGLELALAADLRLAATGTRLALPETRLGLVADVAGTLRLARLVGLSRAKQLHLFGRELRAEEALEWGLVDEVVPPGELDAALERWVQGALSTAPLAAGLAKRLLEHALTEPPEIVHELERLAQTTLLGSRDLAEALAAWSQRRAPRFQGR